MSIISDIKNITYSDLSKMSNESLVALVAKGSKLYKQNIRRLEKQEKLANVSKAFNENVPKIVERTQKTASKLSRNELKKEIEKLKTEFNKQTTSVSSTKKFISKMNQRLGIDITNLSADDWRKIREKIEEDPSGPYGSEEVIQSYYEQIYGDSSEDDNYTEMQELSEEDVIQAFENLEFF